MSLHDFPNVSAPLKEILEIAYKTAGRRKNSAIKSNDLKKLG